MKIAPQLPYRLEAGTSQGTTSALATESDFTPAGTLVFDHTVLGEGPASEMRVRGRSHEMQMAEVTDQDGNPNLLVELQREDGRGVLTVANEGARISFDFGALDEGETLGVLSLHARQLSWSNRAVSEGFGKPAEGASLMVQDADGQSWMLSNTNGHLRGS